MAENRPEVFGFRENTATKLERIADIGLPIEQTLPAMPSRRPFELAIAKAPTGGIAARSGTTPGSGTITFWRINDSGYLETTGATATAYNLSAIGAVASEAYIYVAREKQSGKWIIIWEDCT